MNSRRQILWETGMHRQTLKKILEHSEPPGCGFNLTALLTKQACEEMPLKPGDSVVAQIKAPHTRETAITNYRNGKTGRVSRCSADLSDRCVH